MANSEADDDPTLPIQRKVAIVGIGCRYPKNITNVREFWDMIMAGEDCTSPHPKERLDPSYIYPDEKLPGKIYTRGGGYLSQNVYDFDRNFFQTSPEEADHMDPQLRLLLEVVWESLEDYGVNVPTLRKSDTGVYIGVMTREYCSFLTTPDDNINQYTASGNNSNMMSNRVSYQFDFQGPSMTFDTACSSSLYAIHHACEAIRNGDCDLAVAGGVNLLLQPATHIALCQARMVAPDGKCKSFDVSADGYSRGEGAGVLVLKSLKAAMRDKDRIYAVVRGGALNNDGKTSGIIAPSAESQMMLLRRAYEKSQVNPHEVPYVEAHGTGTQAGDKAEATALGHVLGNGRAQQHPPLIVGSVKSNMGHTEGAAGVAGVIKTSLVLQRKKIPKIVHFQKRNENVDWDKCRITFPTEIMAWPKDSKYLAGCSGFGFGGANAHLVLEAAPTSNKSEKCVNRKNCFPSLLFLSTSSKEALEQRVCDWLQFLSDSSNNGTNFGDIVHTAATRSTHHPYRLAIYCESLEQSMEVMRKKQTSPSEVKNLIAEGRVQTMPSGERQKLVFVFSGMGTQWWGMGRQLMQTSVVFSDMIQEADKLLKEFGAKWSLVSLLTKEKSKEKINDTEIAQPSICALQIALAEVYRHKGIVPQAVIGHSVGEVAAACVAGYLSLRDAMKLIYIRGKTLQHTTGKGTMAAILCRSSDVREKLSSPEFQGKVDIACVNSPAQTVVSGDVDTVTNVVNHFKSQGTRCVTLKVQNAFHSFQQEEIKEIFLQNSKFLENHTSDRRGNDSPSHIPMISTVTGHFVSAKDLNDNHYWWQNIRQTVEFETSLMKMFEEGYDIFLEIGPHPSLASAIKGTMTSFSDSFATSFHEHFAVIGSLRRPSDLSQLSQDNSNILMSIAKLHVQGYPLNLEMIFPNEPYELVSLPTYPWQRQQCIAITEAAKRLYLTPRTKHPLLGEQLVLFPEESDNMETKVWKSDYGISAVPWLPHHKIENVIVLPGAAFIDMMLTVATGIQKGSNTVTVEDVHFHKFHYSPDCKGSLRTTSRKPSGSNQWQVVIRTFNESSESWVHNATCSVSMSAGRVLSKETFSDLEEIQGRCKFQIIPGSFYKKLAENGVQIGNVFGCITGAFYNIENQEALVFASLPKAIENETNDFIFHPALLDATFQLFAGFSFVGQNSKFSRDVRVPKSAGSVSVKGQAPSHIFIHGQTVFAGSKKTVNLTIGDSRDGKVFAKMRDIKFAAVGSSKGQNGVQVWEKEWVKIETDGGTSPDHDGDISLSLLPEVRESEYLVISDHVGVASMFVDNLQKEGVTSNTIQTCELSDGISMVEFRAPKDHNRSVVVLSFLDDSEIDPLIAISKERFLQSQVNDVTSLIKTMADLNFKKEQGTQSVWIITKGAVAASPSDKAVNPLMCNGYSLVMTFMNEFPELFVTTIDLPPKQPAEESARWLSKFFQDPIRSENCLALRACDKVSNYQREYQTFSLRLNIRPASDLFFSQKSDKWIVDLNELSSNDRSKYLRPVKDEPKVEENKSPQIEDISIQVRALVKQCSRSISNPTESVTGFLFGGTILQSPRSSDKFRPGCQVVGYRRGSEVTPVLTGHFSDLVPIPSGINISDAMSIIHTYFPLYVAVQGNLKMAEGSLVMMTSNNVNMHLVLGNQLALSKNIKVVIYVQNGEHLPKLCSRNDGVMFASKQSINMIVKNGSVSTLLLHSDVKLGSEEKEVLLSKVRYDGTVAVLGETLMKSNILAARQISVRYVEPEFIWAPENSDLTRQLIDSLLKMFFSNGHRIGTIKSLVENVQIDEINGGQNLDSKILLVNPSVNVPTGYTEAEKLFIADPTSSYLVVGGTKGIGFEIVRWLVSQGAKCVYISGRNAPVKQISQELDQMRKRSICVEYIKCDVTNEKKTEKMLVDIKSRGQFPLIGVFHCAAGFQDERLDDVTREGWAKVFLPKAYGLLLLHQLTMKLGISLQIFAGISSIVQYLGNDGQCNYFSANTFMSSLCEARRLRGLPATVLAPCAISDVGFAAREGFDKFWENRGIRSLVPSEVINAMSWLLVNDTPEFGVTGEIDKESFFKVKTETFKREAKRNQFSVFKKEFPVEFLSRVLNDSSNLLASLNSTEAKTLTEEFLVDFLRQRLGISDQISTEVSLASFGFDSAMSWELSGVIRSKFNVNVSSVELLNDTMKISDICFLMYNRATSGSEVEAG